MKYRVLGKTGLRVSALGLGGHEFKWYGDGHVGSGRMTSFDPGRTDVIERALEGGVNYFDTTFFEEVQSLGYQIAQLKCREQMIINGMIIDTCFRAQQAHAEGQNLASFVQNEMDTRLELLGSDHFDIFMLCNINLGYSPSLMTDLFSEYDKLRRQGKCRFLGVSCHDFAILQEFLQLDLPVDVVMFWHNFPIGIRQPVCGHAAFDPDALDEALRLAADRNLGKVGMKSLTWFERATPFYRGGAGERDDAGDAEAHRSAIAWQSQTDEVHTSVIAVDSAEQLAENLAAMETEPDEALLHANVARRLQETKEE
jgi:aryl-alcohol dehydrogenase-like predicted oxidoreductase